MRTGNSKKGLPAGADHVGSNKPPSGGSSADAAKERSGRVQFDDRGNAIWEWAVATGAFGREVSTERLKKLENPGLSLAEDAPTPFDKVKPNPLGAVKGYNPYDSGELSKTGAPKKKDLKKLSDWLKLKKQAENNNPDDE
jgi:hypothetical protein